MSLKGTHWVRKSDHTLIVIEADSDAAGLGNRFLRARNKHTGRYFWVTPGGLGRKYLKVEGVLMPDSLTDEQRVIDRVLEDCYPVFDPDGHINGTVPGRGAWDCYCGMVVNTTEAEVRAHVAVEIDKALGGLTQEWGVTYGDETVPDESFDDAQDATALADEHCMSCDHCRNSGPRHVVSRFVGGWTPGEES